MEFDLLMHSLWFLWKSDIGVYNSTRLLVSKQCFRFPEVASVTVEYWFERFNTNLRFFHECLGIINFISLNLRLQFLSALKDAYPSWTVDQYMDALKLSKLTMKWYLKTLHKIQCNQYY
ncbi:hypothetical protein M0804_009793 [Polistes exclamans]|nr:hypothetical protein M0804_009793 [Polistes exclamans]